MSLKDLVTNPDGRSSTADAIVLGAFLVTSAVLLWYAYLGKLDGPFFTVYLTAWVTHNYGSKYVAMQRDKNDSSPETPQ